MPSYFLPTTSCQSTPAPNPFLQIPSSTHLVYPKETGYAPYTESFQSVQSMQNGLVVSPEKLTQPPQLVSPVQLTQPPQLVSPVQLTQPLQFVPSANFIRPEHLVSFDQLLMSSTLVKTSQLRRSTSTASPGVANSTANSSGRSSLDKINKSTEHVNATSSSSNINAVSSSSNVNAVPSPNNFNAASSSSNSSNVPLTSTDVEMQCQYEDISDDELPLTSNADVPNPDAIVSNLKEAVPDIDSPKSPDNLSSDTNFSPKSPVHKPSANLDDDSPANLDNDSPKRLINRVPAIPDDYSSKSPVRESPTSPEIIVLSPDVVVLPTSSNSASPTNSDTVSPPSSNKTSSPNSNITSSQSPDIIFLPTPNRSADKSSSYNEDNNPETASANEGQMPVLYKVG
jgi:hypothetical protein